MIWSAAMPYQLSICFLYKKKTNTTKDQKYKKLIKKIIIMQICLTDDYKYKL